MVTLLNCIAVLLAWYILGLVVIALVDNDKESLHAWLKEAPYPILTFLAILLWPIVVGVALYYKHKYHA